MASLDMMGWGREGPREEDGAQVAQHMGGGCGLTSLRGRSIDRASWKKGQAEDEEAGGGLCSCQLVHGQAMDHVGEDC